MTWWVKNFKWKRNWFENNPQNINKKWQPTRWLKLINKRLDILWYSENEKKMLIDNLWYLIHLTEWELIELLNSNNVDVWTKLYVKELLYWKNSYKLLFELIDIILWK